MKSSLDRCQADAAAQLGKISRQEMDRVQALHSRWQREGRSADIAEAIAEVAGLKPADIEAIRARAKKLLVDRRTMQLQRGERAPETQEERPTQPSESSRGPSRLVGIGLGVVVVALGYLVFRDDLSPEPEPGSGPDRSASVGLGSEEAKVPPRSEGLEPDRPADPIVENPTHALLYRFEKGESLRYRFESVRSLVITLAHGDESRPTEHGFRVSGEMKWTCYSAPEEDLLLEVRFNEFQLDPLRVELAEVGEAALSRFLEVQEEIERERLFVRRTPRGEFKEIAFSGNLSDEAREKALLPILDMSVVLSGDPVPTWETIEHDLTGSYRATYAVGREGITDEGPRVHLTRRIERYLEVVDVDPESSGFLGPGDLQVGGAGEVIFDPEAGRLIETRGETTVRTRDEDSPFRISSRRSYAVTFRKRATDPKIARLTGAEVERILENLVVLRVGATPLVTRTNEPDLQEVVIEPDRTFDLVEQLAALNDPERRSFTVEEIQALEELTLALETGEANVRLVTDLILDGQVRPILHTLLAALQAAGSDEAQDALARIAAQPGLAETERASFVGYLAGVEWPSEETVRTLDGYTANPSDEVATAALLGLGQAIHNLAEVDPETARWALGSLERKLAAPRSTENQRIVGLLALGNARDERSLPLLERFSGDEAPALRAAAVAALGSYPQESQATAMIYSVIENDGDTAVLATAVEAVARRPSPETTAFLANQARQHDDREVRRRSLSYLARQLHDPSVRQVVSRMATQDSDEAIRTEAARLLAEDPSGE